MGVYFNPKNGSFTGDKNSRIYVDKTGLLEYLNGLLGTAHRGAYHAAAGIPGGAF